MKKLLLLLFALPIVAMGQTNEPQTRDELRLIEKIYYDRGVYIASDEDRERLKDLVFEMKADSTLKIHVIGYGDKWGGKEVNDRFSYVRAMYIADWIKSCRVPREQIVFVGEGIDSLAVNDTEARRVEVSQIVTIVIPSAPEPEPTPEPTPEPQAEVVSAAATTDPAASQDARSAEPTGEIDPQMQVTPEQDAATQAEAKPKTQSSISLRTNLLYWLTGMVNIGAEWRPGDSPLGVVLSGGYSPFGGANWAHAIGGWYVAPELRYYIPRNDSWFVGAQFVAQGFNYKMGDNGYQGTMIGGGVMGGYKLRLTDLFDMDFTLGAGYAKIDYDKYYHSNGVNVLKAADLSKSTFIPIHAGVNLIWKIK